MAEANDDPHAFAIGNAAFVLALRERGVRDTAILRAMEQVQRERFAPAHLKGYARRDIALPLACGQSMTAPTTVAAMLGLLGVTPGARVLEIGTGSGYVTALLVRLGGRVRSLERYGRLVRTARDTLLADHAEAVVEAGDGLAPDAAGGRVYDRVLVNGTFGAVPEHLCEALAPGGRLVGALATGEGTRIILALRQSDGGLDRKVGPICRLPLLTPGRARHL